MNSEELKAKEVAGYEDYLIYRDGRIFSTKTNKFLKPTLTKSGYLNIRLSNGKAAKTFRVHRLVAMTFSPQSDPKKDQVNHINGMKDDNRIENLEWVSNEENITHLILNKIIYIANFSEAEKKWVRENIEEISANFKIVDQDIDAEKFRRTVILQAKDKKIKLVKTVFKKTIAEDNKKAWMLAALRKAPEIKNKFVQ